MEKSLVNNFVTIISDQRQKINPLKGIFLKFGFFRQIVQLIFLIQNYFEGISYKVVNSWCGKLFLNRCKHIPQRGSIRRSGVCANQGYRQIFVKNYTIIYRVYD